MNSKFHSIAHMTGFIPNFSLYSPPWKLWSNHTDLLYVSECSMFFQIPVTLLMVSLPHGMPFSTLISGFFGDQTVKNLPAVQEIWVQSLGWEDPLEKGMTTHSSILAWRILWTEEPGQLQSMGLQRVWHEWAPNTHSKVWQIHWYS